MHTAISSAVGVKLKSHFTDGAVLLFKDGDNVLPPEAVRNQPELRILRRLRNSVARIGNDKPTRTTQDRMSVAHKALIGIMPGAQPVGIGANLGENGIQFAGNRGTIRYIRTVIASGFQLARTQNPFFKRRS